MDIDTLMTTVYVYVDDWYKQQGQPRESGRGRPVELSDSEVLTLGVVGQWRVGVPWASERGMVGWMLAHGQGWFPQMLGVSGFNYRFRQLWRMFARLQQTLGAQLSGNEHLYEVVDSVPVPAYSLAQGYKRRQRHWLWNAKLGYSPSGWFWGHRWLLSVTAQGVITGWVLSDAQGQDRWLLQGLLSGRALGYIQLTVPLLDHYVKPKRRVRVPISSIGPSLTTGAWTPRCYLADQAFNGTSWLQHWQRLYHATVISAPPVYARRAARWSFPDRTFLARHRQIIETVFSNLTSTFGLKRLAAHSHWGQLARLAAIAAAHNMAIWLNRLTQRPDLAIFSLLC